MNVEDKLKTALDEIEEEELLQLWGASKEELAEGLSVPMDLDVDDILYYVEKFVYPFSYYFNKQTVVYGSKKQYEETRYYPRIIDDDVVKGVCSPTLRDLFEKKDLTAILKSFFTDTELHGFGGFRWGPSSKKTKDTQAIVLTPEGEPALLFYYDSFHLFLDVTRYLGKDGKPLLAEFEKRLGFERAKTHTMKTILELYDDEEAYALEESVSEEDVESVVRGLSKSNATSFVTSANNKKKKLERETGVGIEFVKSKGGTASADYKDGKVRVYVTDDLIKDKDAARRITTSVNHELRHDEQKKSGKLVEPKYYTSSKKIDKKKYYKNENELDAMAVEVADDLKASLGKTKLKHVSASELKKHVDESPRLATIAKEGGSSAISKLTKSVKDIAKDMKESRRYDMKRLRERGIGSALVEYAEKFVRDIDERSQDPLGDLLDAKEEAIDLVKAFRSSNTIPEFISKSPNTLDYSTKDLVWFYDQAASGAFGNEARYVENAAPRKRVREGIQRTFYGLFDESGERRTDYIFDTLNEAERQKRVYERHGHGPFVIKETNQVGVVKDTSSLRETRRVRENFAFFDSGKRSRTFGVGIKDRSTGLSDSDEANIEFAKRLRFHESRKRHLRELSSSFPYEIDGKYNEPSDKERLKGRPRYVLVSRSPEFTDFLVNFFLPQVSDGWWENNSSKPVYDLWANSRVVTIKDLKDPRVPRGMFPGVMLTEYGPGVYLSYNGNDVAFPEDGPAYAKEQMDYPPDEELIRKMCKGVLKMTYHVRSPKTEEEKALFLPLDELKSFAKNPAVEKEFELE